MLRAAVALQLGTLELDVTLTASRDETLAVLGPNGAGKTTLLRILAGLTFPDRGEVSLDGVTLVDTARGVHVPAERRAVGVVFQDYLLFPHLSALENVAFGLRARAVPPREARASAARWLARLGVDAHADARPRALSGGQAQRVALARALALDPKLLLLDEPLAAIDASARGEIRHDLRTHLASFSGVRILVTHDPLEATLLADRLVILEHGHVTQSGTPADVTRQPRSRYVADLVGVNLIRGRAARGEIAANGTTLHAADPIEGEVFALIHPRAVAIHRRPPEGSPRNVWRGRATALDQHTDRVRVRIEGALPVVAEVTPAAVRELALGEGGEVWVSVKATEVSVYPA
jgi:molybdate transport system ATP-binding protein